MAAKKKVKWIPPTVVGSSYCGAGIYKLKFSDGKVIQFNCHGEDYKADFMNPKKGSMIEWLEQFGAIELDKEPKAHFKFSDERNFKPKF